ncbi:hypothetical protein [Streptomyces sp. NPDC005408]|uniref:hypothetical protein n=1 Tax=Streptomyces sp. NPDC005408 TaxID=3155341 RepID=UPI0033B24875
MAMPSISPQQAAQRALHAGLPSAADRSPQVAALAGHAHSIIGALRSLNLEGAAPAAVFRAVGDVSPIPQEPADAAL